MIIEDDRTEKEKKTHCWIVAMTDSFMSGWGRAKNGTSYAGWACEGKHLDLVEKWVRNRSDAKRVRIVGSHWKPKGEGHTLIYVVNYKHPVVNQIRKK